MEPLIHFWKKGYYTEPLLIIVLIYASVVALKNRKKHQALKYIHLYIVALLVVFILTNSTYLNWIQEDYKNLMVDIADYTDHIFTCIELAIFSHFYYELIDKPFIKKCIIFLNIGFLFIFFATLPGAYLHISIADILQARIYTIEAIILLVICLLYFGQIFKKSISSTLINDPTFWVSTGLLFFLTCTLPFSFLEPYIRKNNNSLLYLLYPIFYIFYILLLLMLTKAYLCKPEKT